MKKRYAKHNFAPAKAGREKRPRTYKEVVVRFYPAARCGEDEASVWFVYAMNGTGNVLATSTLSELDAWKRAAAAIERTRP